MVFGVVATRDIERIHDWLLINRGFDTTKAFTDALDEVLLRLGRMPECGHPVRTGVGFSLTLRRVGLAETGYWIYSIGSISSGGGSGSFGAGTRPSAP